MKGLGKVKLGTNTTSLIHAPCLHPTCIEIVRSIYIYLSVLQFVENNDYLVIEDH